MNTLTPQVMFTIYKPAKLTDIFRIPFGIEMPLEDIINNYPEFITEMNGEDETSTLSFYYQKNPTNGHYEFHDDQAELDVADILQMDLDVYRDGESAGAKELRVTSEEVNKNVQDLLSLLSYDDDLLTITDNFEEEPILTKKERKALKKERRAKIIENRENNAKQNTLICS
jgi:hypothetical protein